MWETVLSIMAAACCLRRKKPKTRQGSTNRMAEVAREEAEDGAESEEESDSGVTAMSPRTQKLDETEEKESDSGETGISIRSQEFETVPDKLFDYGLNRLPPELEGLETSDFLEQPEQPNLALLPKHILARICEMLPPKDFGGLSQTCRLLHWRMIKLCQCHVKELDIEVRKAGRRSNGDVRVVMYPEMAYSIYMKHIVFERVNVHITIGFSLNGIGAFLNEVAVIFGQCRNIKNLEFSFCEITYFLIWSDCTLRLARKLLRDTRAIHLNVQCLPRSDETTRQVDRYCLEHQVAPPIYKDRQGRRPNHKDIVVSEPYEIYLMDVPVASIDQMVRYFLDVKGHGIRRHQYCYAMEDREELDKRLKQIMTWAESKGWTCFWAPSVGIPLESYNFSDLSVGEFFNVSVLPEVLLCHFKRRQE